VEGACTQVLLLSIADLGFFHFVEIVTGWLVPSAGQKTPIEPGSVTNFPPEDPAC
jgi:hypothetical protein